MIKTKTLVLDKLYSIITLLCYYRMNNSLFINKFYDHLLDKIIIYNDTNKNNINKRYSIIPYTKWHYKYIFKEL